MRVRSFVAAGLVALAFLAGTASTHDIPGWLRRTFIGHADGPVPNGIYKVRFSVGSDEGVGIVELQDGRLFGGDSTMYYLGHYTVTDGRVSGTLKVAKYADVPGLHSILGGDDYVLTIDGTVKPGAPVVVTGTTPHAPGVAMKLALERI